MRKQVALLFATVREAAVADAMVAIVFAAIKYWQLRDPLIGVWLALHLGKKLRVHLLTAYYRDPDATSRSDFWVRRYSREALIYSYVWGWRRSCSYRGTTSRSSR